jgi:hypothetical protein
VFKAFTLSDNHPVGQSHFFYNHFHHLLAQSKRGWRVYEWVHEKNRQTEIRLAMHVEGDEARSPYRAPFGGVEISHPVANNVLQHFMHLVERDLAGRGVKKISIQNFPEGYQPGFSKLIHAFSSLHYQPHTDITSVISVNRFPLERRIKISEQQKLRKARQVFRFEEVPIGHFSKIYSFIEACRKERNQMLSMTRKELKKLIKIFPHRFLLFQVAGDDGLAAACIAIRVSETVLYTFYYGHARKYDRISPVVMLLCGIYDYARQEGIRLIDLGTSRVDGEVKGSLLHFKKSMGAKAARKHKLTKVLP